MAHQDRLISLTLEGLDTVDHTDILAHLESSFGDFELDKLEAVLADDFEEALTEFCRSPSDFHTLSISVSSQIL